MLHSIKREVYQKNLYISCYLNLIFSLLPCINSSFQISFALDVSQLENKIQKQLGEHTFGCEDCFAT